MEDMNSVLMLGAVAVMVFFGAVLAILGRYRKCPSDKVMVIYGKVGSGRDGSSRSSKCLHGGAAFVWPIFQDYQYLDLTPFSINIDLRNALSKQNIRIDVPARFTVGISTEPGVMQNAAERLLGLKLEEVQNLAGDIIFGQLRLVIASMNIEEINTDRDGFQSKITENVESELRKIGIRLINVNVTDITDESGYIDALGQEAAAKAINDAKVTVAERNRDGNMGKAKANSEEKIGVSEQTTLAIKSVAQFEADQKIAMAQAQAETEAGQKEAESKNRIKMAELDARAREGEKTAESKNRIRMASLDAEAVEGENEAKIRIMQSESSRREREAEAKRRALATEKVQAAGAMQEAFAAEEAAEKARAAKEKATMEADVLVKAEIEKRRMELEAEADAEQARRTAQGEADAMFAKMEAQARGLQEILSKQAEGYAQIIQSAGGDADAAIQLMMANKIEELVKIQVEAIKGINIDKITVWDSMNGADGASTTANFLNSITKAVPPISDLFKMTGVQAPGMFAQSQSPAKQIQAKPSAAAPARSPAVARSAAAQAAPVKPQADR